MRKICTHCDNNKVESNFDGGAHRCDIMGKRISSFGQVGVTECVHYQDKESRELECQKY